MVKTDFNFVPDKVNPSPDYYCTWQTQLYATSDGKPIGQRKCIGEHSLFAPEKPYGWAYFHPDARKDLFLIMDDSWDVPLDGDSRYYGSLQLDPEKFPDSASHGFPLKHLTDRILQNGWKGLGGWVCAQESPLFPAASVEDYWIARMQQAQSAGFSYWKVDWGEKATDAQFRKMLTALAKQYAPDLHIEHAMTPEIIPEIDSFRTYDVPAIGSIPMTMKKLADLANMSPTAENRTGLINCEDEVYMAAAGGYTMGVMRHPYAGNLPDGRADMSFPAIHRNLKTKMFEVVRAVRWHRIAPAFDTGCGITHISSRQLTDTWHFENYDEEIENWWLSMPLKEQIDHDILTLTAPASIARNTQLPDVAADPYGLIPYTLCSHNPNGTYSIMTAGRTLNRSYFIPRCSITAEISNAETIGIFGEYQSLTLRFDGPAPAKVFMQDLSDDHAFPWVCCDCCVFSSVSFLYQFLSDPSEV